MVTKSDKERVVDELKEKFSKAKSVFNTKQLGLSVAQITELRDNVRDLKAEFKIAKNTLFRKAAEGTDFEDLTSNLTGPTAFLFCYDDEVAPAAKIKDFSKDNDDKVNLETCFVDGQVLDKEGTQKVLNLPAKEVLLSQIAGMLVQPTSQIAGLLTTSASEIASIMGQAKEKGEGDKQLKDLAA